MQSYLAPTDEKSSAHRVRGRRSDALVTRDSNVSVRVNPKVTLGFFNTDTKYTFSLSKLTRPNHPAATEDEESSRYIFSQYPSLDLNLV